MKNLITGTFISILLTFAACFPQTANANQTHTCDMNMTAMEIHTLSEKDKARFLVKFTKVEGCWIWMGCKTNNGHGRFSLRKKARLAHRIAWVIANGQVPNSLLVCHKCDVRDCVNPDHLFLGTYQDNAMDMILKGRGNRATGDRHFSRTMPHRVARGESAGSAKLKETDVREIRRRFDNGQITRGALAEEYGVGRSCIQAIVTRKKWRHVT